MMKVRKNSQCLEMCPCFAFTTKS